MKFKKNIFKSPSKSISDFLFKKKCALDLPNDTNNSDLFIVEYPKSGITWLSTIIANSCFIEANLSKSATHFNLEQFIGDVHQNKVINDNEALFPYHRIIKSHSSFNPFYRNVIYLVRNPFSVMVSYYNYCVSNKFFSGTFDDFIRSKEYGIINWQEHVRSWIKPRKHFNLHFIRYEDLLDRTNDEISSLYKNLGWNISEDGIKKAVSLSEFKNMKLLNDHYKKYCPFRSYDFVREGKKYTEISESSREYIKNHCREILSEIYPEMI